VTAGVKGATGLYLYGIVSPEIPLAPSDKGVDPSFAPFLLEHAGLAALVSEVSLDDFGPEALKTNLNELEWLERCARAHEEVVERAVDAGPVLPARLAVVYRGADEVRQLLARERDRFTTQLRELDGKREWGVKAFADDEELARSLEESGEDLEVSPPAVTDRGQGAAYLARRKRDMVVRGRVAETKARRAESIHAALVRESVGARLNPLHRSALVRDSDDLVLNGAYLVARRREGQFLASARDVDEVQRKAGIRLEVSGPWPPYNFVNGIDTTSE
jgi:hypothetical protein